MKRRTLDLGIVSTCDRTVRIYFLDRKIPFAVDINMSSFYATTGYSFVNYRSPFSIMLINFPRFCTTGVINSYNMTSEGFI